MPPAPSTDKPLLLFLVTEDWYFYSHRLPLARAAQQAGFRIAVATRINSGADRMLAEGFEVYNLPWQRGSINPFHEILFLFRIILLYRRVRPALVHHIAIKPILYGSIAARFLPGLYVVNAIAGLGAVYTDTGRRARILRPLLSLLFRLVLGARGSMIMSQNSDDLVTLRRCRALSQFTPVEVIKGSGVDTDYFSPLPDPDTRPLQIALVSRMLKSKGIPLAVEAARILHDSGADVELHLVGAPDPENPITVAETTLKQWHQSGLIVWDGYCHDVRQVWAKSAIAILPSSYGEGLPKSLLEAAACGRPLIATDIAGCREIVVNDETGFLIPCNDAHALAAAIARLALDRELRQRLGTGARRLVEREFSTDIVISKTMSLYRTLLRSNLPKDKGEQT